MLRKKMLRTPQAAEYLGIAAATLAKWRVFGGGPNYVKMGRAVAYDLDVLHEWLEARVRRSTSATLSVRAKEMR